MKLAYKLGGIVIEPAGAVGLAAATMYRARFRGRLIVTSLCGSSVWQ